MVIFEFFLRQNLIQIYTKLHHFGLMTQKISMHNGKWSEHTTLSMTDT